MACLGGWGLPILGSPRIHVGDCTDKGRLFLWHYLCGSNLEPPIRSFKKIFFLLSGQQMVTLAYVINVTLFEVSLSRVSYKNGRESDEHFLFGLSNGRKYLNCMVFIICCLNPIAAQIRHKQQCLSCMICLF